MRKNKVFIIAEAGVNHNGEIKTAKRMVDAAVLSGADAVKFQTFKAGNLSSKFALKAKYQSRFDSRNKSQLEMLRKLELGTAEHIALMKYCRKKKIMFLSSAFDLESIDLLQGLGVRIFKIPSGEITNLPYLRKVGGLKKKIILSTGMSRMDEIASAISLLVKSGAKKDEITLLHCNTQYPTPFEDVNLMAMVTMKNNFKVKVGYSDHTLGIEVPIAAVALGAVVIEKHFTLNKNMVGPDHKSSLEPGELKAMVKAIRNIENALGDGFKRPSGSEKENIALVRKSIVAAGDIHKGEIFREQNIAAKRPGTGISPMQWDIIIGKAAGRDFLKDELISI